MPELPEVETVKRGITPAISHQTVAEATVRQPKLRYPIPTEVTTLLPGQTIHQINRRSKYLLLEADTGHLIIHLGMSGRLYTLTNPPPAGKHDHVDILFNNGICLRYQDPRRFGMVLWTHEPPETHRLLQSLGPEPLTNDFHENHLFERSRRKSVAVKSFIMDSKVVVGVGNIYASEALFLAGIRPSHAANRISRARYQTLTQTIRAVLNNAIDAGGTSFRDFKHSDGQPGYFQQKLFVYGREGKPCRQCATPIKKITQGQRSTFYCSNCQT